MLFDIDVIEVTNGPRSSRGELTKLRIGAELVEAESKEAALAYMANKWVGYPRLEQTRTLRISEHYEVKGGRFKLLEVNDDV